MLFVYSVRGRSPPGHGFVWNEMFIVYMVRDLFWLREPILYLNKLKCIRSGTVQLRELVLFGTDDYCVYGPGPFDSGSRFLFWNRILFYIVYMVWDRSAPGADFLFWNRILLYCVYGPGPFCSGSRLCFGTEFLLWIRSGTVWLLELILFWNRIMLCIRSGTIRLREPILFWNRIMLCIRSGTVQLRELILFWNIIFIVYTVQDRSAPGADFVLKQNIIVYTVRDRSAPRADFVLEQNFYCVYGPGLFGSGSRFCFETEYYNCVCDPGLFGSGSRFWFETEYCCFSAPVAGFVWNWIYRFTVRGRFRLWEPVWFGTEYYYVCGPICFAPRTGFFLFGTRIYLCTRSGTVSAPGTGFFFGIEIIGYGLGPLSRFW